MPFFRTLSGGKNSIQWVSSDGRAEKSLTQRGTALLHFLRRQSGIVKKEGAWNGGGKNGLGEMGGNANPPARLIDFISQGKSIRVKKGEKKVSLQPWDEKKEKN